MPAEVTSEITVDVLATFGSDQDVIAAMKVLDGGCPPDKDDRARIRYLMQHRHGTPFEHNMIRLFVDAPIFVWREWHRHRIAFSYNEESARYSTLRPKFFVPHRGRPMIKTGDGWKPGRPKFLTLDEAAAQGAIPDDPDSLYRRMVDEMTVAYARDYDLYERQLARGLDPGLARDNLPVGVFSRCWVTCNLRSALAFISLRTHEPAARYVSYPLYEIEQAARRLEAVVRDRFPLCYAAFCDFGRVGP